LCWRGTGLGAEGISKAVVVVYYRRADLCGRNKGKARRRPSNRIWWDRFGAAAADWPAFSNCSPVPRLAWDRSARLGAARLASR
jgi:hypothetical protein